MYLRICGSLKSAKSNWVRKSQLRKSQITKNTVYGLQTANFQIRKLSHLRNSEHLTNYLTLQICGFALSLESLPPP